MLAKLALLALHLAAMQVAPQPDDECGERVYHPPGAPERIEGVYYSWIDNDGFVPCATAAECRGFIERDSLGIELSEEASNQIRDFQRPYRENWGEYRIRFIGRRGAMTLPDCADHTLPDLPFYVRVEQVLSVERLDDLAQ